MEKMNRRNFVKTSLQFTAGAVVLTLIPSVGKAETIEYRVVSMIGLFNHNHENAKFLDNNRIETGWGGLHTHGTIKISSRREARRIAAAMRRREPRISFGFLDHTVIIEKI